MNECSQLRTAADGCLLCLGIVSAAMPTLDELITDRVQQMQPGLDASGNTQSTLTGCADGTAYNFLVHKGTTNVNRVLYVYSVLQSWAVGPAGASTASRQTQNKSRRELVPDCYWPTE